jgi:peptide/nickel transport system substrate-binding protein
MTPRVALLAAALAAGLIASPALAQGKRFVFANVSQYDSMDVHTYADVGRIAVRLNLYDGLYRWLDNPPQLTPWLAEGHTISEDGLVYTFKLKPAKFHDGADVTAEDVVYSAERIIAVKKGIASLLAGMLAPNGAKALDKQTVQFTLKAPTATFLSVVPEIHVMNAKLLKSKEKDGDWGQAWLAVNEAGSGSYQLDQFDPAVGFIAKRFAGHFVKWGPKYLDEIEFRHVKEDNTKVLGMIKGDFHGTGGYLPQDLLKKLREAPNVTVMEAPSMRIMFVQINAQKLTDVNFRRAINYTFDYDGFINEMQGGLIERNAGPIPKPMWGWPQDLKGYTFDIDKAKAELAKAKDKPNRPLEVVAIAGFSQSEQAAVVLQNGLKRAGVEAKVTSVPWPTVVERMAKPDTTPDMTVYWISTYYADPHNWIGEMYSSSNWGTFKASNFYKNPKVDELLADALKVTDQKARAAKYEEATRIVVDEAPGLWISNTKWFGPWSKSLEGIRFSPVGDGQEMRWAHFKG